MPTARVNLAAVLGSDGKIYAIGGNDQQGKPLRSVEAFDPATNTWISRAPLPAGGGRLTAVTARGKIYAIGGDGASG
jgi:N-acetylneuraminic acid mutarotase